MPVRNTLPKRLLWVEGKDDSALVQSLCKNQQVPEVFLIEDRQGFRNVLKGLGVELRRRGLERFGIVVDANGDVDARWASIRNILLSEGYPEAPDSPAPDGTILSAPGRARVGAWLMPDNASPGMLEDFAARLIPADDYLWARAAEVVDGIPDEHRRFAAGHRSKAVVHTWLAWQETPGSPMGQAIGQGSLPATAPDALRFVAWLRRLMIDDMPDPP